MELIPSNLKSVNLSNFKGPLQLLVFLIQKQELDIFDIALKELTDQYFLHLQSETNVDAKTEFLPVASFLLLLKSRRLLPETKEELDLEDELDIRSELMTKLLEYTRFKEFAQTLSHLETEENHYFFRKVPLPEKANSLGLDEVGIVELASLLSELIKKKTPIIHTIVSDEEWEIGPKLKWLKESILTSKKLPFNALFSSNKSKTELIVLFLALLELMKQGHLSIVKEDSTLWICETI